MKTIRLMPLLMAVWCMPQLFSQVNVDVNLDIKHSVNGVSDFGRERHITLHSSLSEPDWEGEDAKAKYLLDDLDVYMGRDNGSATWKFQYSAEDPDNPNHHDPDSLKLFANWWLGEYERTITDNNMKRFESRTTEMICGTNPHPTYPTLSYWYMCGSEWGRANGYDWLPQDIETSAAWMVDYLDFFFVNSLGEQGELMPKYWEVINEPDMKMNTGAFMVTSWEDIWEYHNLVAQGVKQRLGNNAPLIGGMTWGLHDLNGDDLNRYRNVGYSDAYYGNTPGDEAAKQHARNQTESAYLTQTGEWTQWDVLWKGFMNAAGGNMDFYSVHLYDWPTYAASGGAKRTGGHVEAVLDLVEWYDVSVNGFANRKPIVLSEYGSVQGAWDYTAHDKRYDWEVIKPFSAMLMQFLERPDYIIKSMPFTPIKATWGDTDSNGDGVPEYRYQYTMMRDDDMDGNWVWSDYIKWFELWAEVDGTRVDTKSSDPDIQVDCYIDGREVFLILNNLEDEATSINLHTFGTSLNPQSVRIKQLYLSGVRDIVLADNTQNSAPSSVTLQPEATMILKYTYGSNISINNTSVEKKFFGNSVGSNQRVSIAAGDNTFYVNNVTVPSNTSQAEAMLRLTVNLYDDEDDKVGHLSIDKLVVNGNTIEAPVDWRGTNQGRSRYFGTLEIPIPANVLQRNNTIVVDFHHVGEVCVANIVTWEFSKVPGRSDGDIDPDVPVTGVTVSPTSASVNVGATTQLSANVLPSNATNKVVSWSSNNTNIATVNGSGVVTGVAQGSATITATTQDGNKKASSTISVTTGDIPVTGVTVAPTSASIAEGATTQLTATVEPGNATNKSVSWSSNNTSVASVNSSGLVTANSAGSATITVTTADGNKKATSAITVTDAGDCSSSPVTVEAESFTTTGGTYNDGQVSGGGVNRTSSTINWVNSGDWAEYSINLCEAGDYEIEYQISTPMDNAQIQIVFDGTVASTDNVVNNGQWDSYQALKAANKATLSAGVHTMRLNATGSNNWQWNLDKITLTKTGGSVPVTGVDVTPATLTLTSAGATSQLSANVSPSNATNKSVNWSSNNTSVATVNSSGVVTAVANGNATITATTVDQNKKDNCAVTVSISSNDGDPIPGKIEAEDYVDMNGIQTQATSDVGGGENVGWIGTGDWMDYKVNVASAGTYTVDFRVASLSNNIVFDLKNGNTVLTSVNSATTGGWQSWKTVSSTVTLSAGEQTLRILATGSSWNINWMEFKSGGNNDPILVTGVDVTPATVTLTSAGATSQLSANVLPSNATNKTVSWSSNNTSVATVNSNGVVTAVANGTATITATTADQNKKDNCVVTVSIANNGDCDLPYTNAGFSITKETKNWTSGSIDISCATSINISIDIEGVGPMEAADYLNVYYKLNGGSQVAISENTNAFSKKTVSATNLSGNTVEIIIEGKTSWSDETYTVSNISVTSNGGNDGGGNDGGGNNGDGTLQLTNVGSSITLEVGETYQLEWNSSEFPNVHFNTNSGYANVDWNTGLITGSVISNGHTATITIYDDGGSGQTDAVLVYVVAQGTKSAEAESLVSALDVNIYPNPVNDILNIVVNGDIQDNAQVMVYQTTGALVHTLNVDNNQLQLDTDNLSTGMYILKVINGSEVVSTRFFKN